MASEEKDNWKNDGKVLKKEKREFDRLKRSRNQPNPVESKQFYDLDSDLSDFEFKRRSDREVMKMKMDFRYPDTLPCKERLKQMLSFDSLTLVSVTSYTAVKNLFPPAEIGLVKFSLTDGVLERRNYLLDLPDDLKNDSFYSDDIRKTAECKNTGHGIPIDGEKPESMRTDYQNVLDEIMAVTNSTRYGYLFCLWKNYNAVQAAMEFLRTHSPPAQWSIDKDQVKCIDDIGLVYLQCVAECLKDASVSSERNLDLDGAVDIGCQFHRRIGNRNCATTRVHGILYAFLKQLKEPLQIDGSILDGITVCTVKHESDWKQTRRVDMPTYQNSNFDRSQGAGNGNRDMPRGAFGRNRDVATGSTGWADGVSMEEVRLRFRGTGTGSREQTSPNEERSWHR